jgi:type IV pilus assembly protein PilM
VAAVAAALRQLWASAKFQSKRVVLGVANQRVIVRQADVPWMPMEEMRSSLAFQVQDMVPMPIDQAILDFHPVEEFVSDSGARHLRILLVAAARDMIMTSLDATRQAGLTVSQVDLTPFAVLRSLAIIDHLGMDAATTPTADALVDIGARVTNVIVHQNGLPRFVRILLMGGDDITEAVAERMGIPFAEADSMKHEFGIGAMPGLPVTDHPAAKVVETVGAGLIDEIRGSLDYYLAQPSSPPMRRLILAGGGSALSGLPERLANATRVPVQGPNILAGLRLGNVGLSSAQLAEVERQITVPVGLAMGAAK